MPQTFQGKSTARLFNSEFEVLVWSSLSARCLAVHLHWLLRVLMSQWNWRIKVFYSSGFNIFQVFVTNPSILIWQLSDFMLNRLWWHHHLRRNFGVESQCKWNGRVTAYIKYRVILKCDLRYACSDEYDVAYREQIFAHLNSKSQNWNPSPKSYQGSSIF